MARYNITDQVQAAWDHYDRILTENIRQISEISNVPPEKLIKLNPAEFIEPNKFQIIDGYRYQKIEKWISRQKTDDTYLISPADAVQETANQIAYKENHISETIRASKCKVIPIPQALAMDFYIRNHRQSLPSIRATALSFGLIYKDQLVAAMTYDKSNGAVRGKLKDYELLRLEAPQNCRQPASRPSSRRERRKSSHTQTRPSTTAKSTKPSALRRLASFKASRSSSCETSS